MLSKALIEEIRALHVGPDRGYHGWSHPVALLKWFEAVKDKLHDPLAVECAILLHDAIYEPRATDNEAKSAELAQKMLQTVVPKETLARTISLIEATARHVIPNDLSPDDVSDTAHFLDMDLSILGSADDVFDAYEAGVRHEYREIPIELFCAGRARILEGFLAREHLYFSNWGREQFDEKARANLARSIAVLKGNAS